MSRPRAQPHQTPRKGRTVLFFAAALAVTAGAIAQRVSGMGFALVAAPFFILLFGPFEGVLLINAGGALSSMLVFLQTRNGVNWRQYFLLVIPAMMAILPGALITIYLNRTTLQLVLGILLIVALIASILVSYTKRHLNQGAVAILFGGASGFMSATVGLGGPAVGIYGVLTRWEQKEFASTLQPYFFTLGASSFLTKIILTGELPDVSPWIWPSMVLCTLIGLAIGKKLQPHVRNDVARNIVIVICLAGAVATVIDALMA